MMNKNQILKVMVFCLAFICFGVGGTQVWATQATQMLDLDGDTLVDLWIEYASGYPGHFLEINVKMANLTEISNIKLHMTLSDDFLINFHTDSIGTEWVAIPLDTCPGPDTCLVDTCYWEEDSICMDTLYLPVRYCYIDTVGSLISDFVKVICHGQVGDTTNNDCKYLTVWAEGGNDSTGEPKFIPVDPNYRLLFKFGVDLLCLCDAETLRTEYFLINPIESGFSDPEGHTVLYEYHMGRLDVYWSVPGDANNDSLTDIADASFLINYLFIGGPEPCIWEAADCDSSCVVDIGDASCIINWLYQGGPKCKRGCACPYPWKGKRIDKDLELFEELNLKPLLERR